MLPNITRSLLATAFTALMISTTSAVADNTEDDDRLRYESHPHKKHHHDGSNLHVDCDDGQTLTKTLEVAKSGSTIFIEGTCNERVVIKTDGLTLDGQGDAVMVGSGLPTSTSIREGGLITVDTARDVTLRGLGIDQSPEAGVVILRGASVDIEDMTIDNVAFVGIYLYENATVEAKETAVSGSGAAGFIVNGNSYLALKGDIRSANNGGDGIAVWGESTLDLLEANVLLSDNGRAGLFAFDAQVHANSIAFVGASSVSATNNGVAGIAIVGGGSMVFSLTTSITVKGSPTGLWVSNGSIGNPFGAGSFYLSGNDVGMKIDRGGRVRNAGALTIEKNKTGMAADNALDVTIASLGNMDPPVINANDLDIDLTFGSRVTFNDVTYHTISCDGTVLTRDANGDSFCN